MCVGLLVCCIVLYCGFAFGRYLALYGMGEAGICYGMRQIESWVLGSCTGMCAVERFSMV
jgi:hypothetical protein